MKNIQKQTDEVILAKSIEDPAQFSLIVEKYRAPLLRIAYNIVRQREEAEDIVQEAFTRMYINAAKFQRQEGASFKSWAYRITFNTAVSQYRMLKRKFAREAALDVSLYENLPSRESLAAETEAKIVAEEMLVGLPSDLKRVIEKFYFEDKSYETISREEGISLSTLKMRLFRAKRLLKQRYGETQ